MSAEPFDLRSHARQFGEIMANVSRSTRPGQPARSADLHCAMLAVAIQDALARGVRHYDRAGRLLATDVEVAEALLAEGTVTLLGPEAETGLRP